MRIQINRSEEKLIEKRLREEKDKTLEFEDSRVVSSDGLCYSLIVKVQRTSKLEDEEN